MAFIGLVVGCAALAAATSGGRMLPTQITALAPGPDVATAHGGRGVPKPRRRPDLAESRCPIRCPTRPLRHWRQVGGKRKPRLPGLLRGCGAGTRTPTT